MSSSTIHYSDRRDLPGDDLIALYRANEWSSAEKLELLHNSTSGVPFSLFCLGWQQTGRTWQRNLRRFLVVYYPHLIVLPEYQGRGVGTELMLRLMARYAGFHQHMHVADGRAIDFYRKCGLERAGKTEPMWIYAGHDH